jgi:5-formyltetrahydrofolate cyclo-ligase
MSAVKTKDIIRKEFGFFKDSTANQQKAAQSLYDFLKTKQNINKLFLYHALPKEIDVSLLRQLGIACALPRMKAHAQMDFHLWQDSLQRDTRTGIYEPPEDAPLMIPDNTSVIVVPGLAFSPLGFRVGRGRGYYDRYLEQHPYGTRIGICTDARIVSFQEDPHDQAVHLIQTETTLLSRAMREHLDRFI